MTSLHWIKCGGDLFRLNYTTRPVYEMIMVVET